MKDSKPKLAKQKGDRGNESLERKSVLKTSGKNQSERKSKTSTNRKKVAMEITRKTKKQKISAPIIETRAPA